MPKSSTRDLNDLAGLKSRIEYGTLVKKYRNISPRVLQGIQQLKTLCGKDVKLPSKSKERGDLMTHINASDDMLRSYWYVFIRPSYPVVQEMKRKSLTDV